MEGLVSTGPNQFNFKNKVHFEKFIVSTDHKEDEKVISMHYLLSPNDGQLLHSLSPTFTLREHLRKRMYRSPYLKKIS